MTVLDQHTVTARVGGLTLVPTAARMTLDESWSPWAQGELTCKLPADLDALDLRTATRWLELRVRQDFAAPWTLSRVTDDVGGSVAALTTLFGGKPLSAFFTRYSRAWNAFGRRPSTSRRMRLVVHERAFDHKAKTVTLSVASGEQLLLSDALIATSPLDPGSTNLRTIVNAVLGRHGMSLQPGDVDGTVEEAEATLWQPGTSAWDYLAPLLEAAGVRLWCDEVARWWLTEPQPVAPGAVVLSTSQPITELVDTMTLSGEEWFDAVVVEYRWVDEFDLNRVEVDVAGPEHPRNVLRLERTTAYPGPGAAAGILNRAKGRGRVLEVDAVSDYTVTPGMPAAITPPDTELQTGYVAAVEWRWPENEMSVTSRGLVDTPPFSWLAAPTGLAWDDIPAGMSWTEYDPELIGA